MLQEHRDRAMASGMDDYVAKPYERAAFVELILRCLRHEPPYPPATPRRSATLP